MKLNDSITDMIPLNKAVFIDRKEVAIILEVSVQTLEVWRSIDRHRELHKDFFKMKGRTCYYKLSEVEEFLKSWNPKRYEEYIARKSQQDTRHLADV